MGMNLTLKAKKKYDSFNTSISALHLKYEFENQVFALKNCTKAEYPSESKDVVRLYRSIGMECEMGQPPEYYIGLLKTIPEGVLYDSKEELDNEIWKYLYEIYKGFPEPCKIMKRILDNCGSEEFKKEKSLRLRILKEFLSQGHGLTAAGYSGLAYIKKYTGKKDINELLSVDDGVFDILKKATKDEKKDKYSLLVLAQEFAEGKFKNNGASKEPLYLLAIVLDMKYYPNQTDDYVEKNDFVKNIFNDYYNDNLIRYITSYKNVHPTAYEDEPLGLGVDYKNYAEAVFIYYMNKECYSSTKKIKLIYKVLKNIKSIAAKTEKINNNVLSTKQQKENFIKIFLQLDETEIEKYILSNYNCAVEKNASPFGLEFSQNTVYECYDAIRGEIIENLKISEEAFKTSWGFIDSKKYPKEDEDGFVEDGYEIETDALSELNLNALAIEKIPSFSPDFKVLVEKINERLDPYSALSIYDDAGVARVTRSKLIAAYFHGYCIDNVETPRSFADVLIDFEMWLNESLEQCGFSRLDYKNVFDMLVVFFAYCKINNKLYEED